MHRGEIWWADLGEPRGSSPGGVRPVVIVQADAYNASALRTTLAIGVTTNLQRAHDPGNVLLPAGATGLKRDSVANVTQLTSIDRDELGERIGSLDRWLLEQVDAGLRRVLDL